MACFAREVARERHHRRRAEQADMDARACRTAPRAPATARSQTGDELAAGRGRDALDRRDHRLRQADDPLHHRRAAPEHVGEAGAAAVRVGRGARSSP